MEKTFNWNKISELKQFTWKEHRGIYYLIKDDKIVYVWQSVNIHARIKQHTDKNFDTYCFEPIPRWDMEKIEIEEIKRIDPKYNKYYWPNELMRYQLLLNICKRLGHKIRHRAKDFLITTDDEMLNILHWEYNIDVLLFQKIMKLWNTNLRILKSKIWYITPNKTINNDMLYLFVNSLVWDDIE